MNGFFCSLFDVFPFDCFFKIELNSRSKILLKRSKMCREKTRWSQIKEQVKPRNCGHHNPQVAFKMLLVFVYILRLWSSCVARWRWRPRHLRRWRLGHVNLHHRHLHTWLGSNKSYACSSIRLLVLLVKQYEEANQPACPTKTNQMEREKNWMCVHSI